MKEIGGYLELERLKGEEYHKNALKLNCARNAIVLSVNLKKAGRVFLPFYLCGSVKNALIQNGTECVFYGIDENFQPVLPKDRKKEDILIAVNYYGQLDLPELLKKNEGRSALMIDNTQAFFEKPYSGIDTVCSVRKFFGVPDGAYLYTSLTEKAPELAPASVLGHLGHLVGRMEDTAGAHLDEHRKNDAAFAQLPIGGMSLFTRNILRAVDYDSVRRVRSENYKTLHDSLHKKNRLPLKTPDAPFAYPFYVQDGPKVRKKLAENKIYIPTLWPDVLNLPDDRIEKDYAENILPLPCDQRYTSNDMNRLLEVLEACTTSGK